MVGDRDDGKVAYWKYIPTTTRVECPHCDRIEDLSDEATAKAWLIGHIQEAHTDEMPAFDLHD